MQVNLHRVKVQTSSGLSVVTNVAIATVPAVLGVKFSLYYMHI